MSARARPRLLYISPAFIDKPRSGGEWYSHHLLRALPNDWDLTTLDFDELGVGWGTKPTAFAAAVVAAARERGFRGAVLEDSVLYRVLPQVNRALRQEGCGPIISFDQAVYPERASSTPGRWARFLFYRRHLSSVDGIIGVSRYVTDVVRRLRVGTPTAIAYPGFDLVTQLDDFPRRAKPAGVLRLVTAGAYIPAKGQLIAVQAVAEACKRRPEFRHRLRLDLFGDTTLNPAYAEAVRAFVAQEDLGDIVGVHGPLPQEDLWREFARSDVFVFPASGEGLGMVVAEAMLLGCVPLVARAGPMVEIVGDTGVVTGRSIQHVAAGIIHLAEADLTRESDRARAQAKAFAHGWDNACRTFSAALETFAGIPSSAAQEPVVLTAGG